MRTLLLVTAAVGAFASAVLTQERLSDAAFMRLGDAEARKRLALHRLNPSNPLEQMIDREHRALAVVVGFNIPIQAGRGSGTASHPETGVVIDLDQLEKIRATVGPATFVPVLRWILAHETAHQVQFSNNRRGATTSVAEQQVLEAQADLLAGSYLIQSIPPSEQRAITDALRTAFDLGVERYSLADHPSRDARLTAVRFGMAAGIIGNLRRLGGTMPEASARILEQKLDLHGWDDFYAWSVRLARRTVGFERPAAVNIVLTDRAIQFDRARFPPPVKYMLTYENRGNRPVTLDASVQCVGVKRDDPDNVLKWLLLAARNERFTLAPQQREQFSNTLVCDGMPDNSYMPKLVAPPDIGTLLTVEFADEASRPTATAIPTSASLSNEERQTFQGAFNRVVGATLSSFRELRASAGYRLSSTVRYMAEPEFPSSRSTRVYLPEPGNPAKPRVRVEFLEGASTTAATQEIARLEQAFAQVSKPYGKWTRVESVQPDRREITLMGQPLVIRIIGDESTVQNGAFDVHVEFERP